MIRVSHSPPRRLSLRQDSYSSLQTSTQVGDSALPVSRHDEGLKRHHVRLRKLRWGGGALGGTGAGAAGTLATGVALASLVTRGRVSAAEAPAAGATSDTVSGGGAAMGAVPGGAAAAAGGGAGTGALPGNAAAVAGGAARGAAAYSGASARAALPAGAATAGGVVDACFAGTVSARVLEAVVRWRSGSGSASGQRPTHCTFAVAQPLERLLSRPRHDS